jgi:hypothetical protein
MHAGVISYWDKQEYFFDDDRNSLGEISLYSVSSVESNVTDQNVAEGSVFDIHAHVTRGGDSSGMRTFTLQASDRQSCLNWIEGDTYIS